MELDSDILPILVLREGVLFPGAHCRVLLTSLCAYGAVLEATRSRTTRGLAVFAAATLRERKPESDGLFDIGTFATVVGLERSPCCGRWVAELEAHARVRTTERLREHPFRIDRVELLPEPAEDATVVGAMVEVVRGEARRLIELGVAGPLEARDLVRRLQESSDASRVAGAVMELLPPMPVLEQQRRLGLAGPVDRLAFALGKMNAFLSTRTAAGTRNRPS
jgi:ATP-dependent Lon protease